jgi:hypothetical protein
MADSAREERIRRLGRRAGLVVFGTIVSVFTGVCSVQIMLQVWASPPFPTEVECRAGIRGLVHAVRRARLAADREPADERARLARFRGSLRPEWDTRHALERSCAPDPKLSRALDEVDRYRYAEEHSLRSDSASLIHRIGALERELEK